MLNCHYFFKGKQDNDEDSQLLRLGKTVISARNTGKKFVTRLGGFNG
jgi:hypothetical protein